MKQNLQSLLKCIKYFSRKANHSRNHSKYVGRLVREFALMSNIVKNSKTTYFDVQITNNGKNYREMKHGIDTTKSLV